MLLYMAGLEMYPFKICKRLILFPKVKFLKYAYLFIRLQGKGLDDLDNYIVPVSLGDNQGVMGAVKLAMDACAERGNR